MRSPPPTPRIPLQRARSSSAARVGTWLLALAGSAIASADDGGEDYLELFRQGDRALQAGALEVAAASLEACLELEPESPVAAFHLACAAARSGEPERALDALGRAFANGHDDPGLAEREPDLESLRELPGFRRLLDRAQLRLAERQRDVALPERAIEWRFGTEHPAFSPDGKRFVTLGCGDGFLWDAESGELLQVLDNGGAGPPRFVK